MYEVEIKLRADHAAVRSRLEELDAEPLGGVTQIDTYFDAPHRDFAETDEALRIRRETPLDAGTDGDTEARLTYKGPLVEAESKTREEIETAVRNGDDVRTILEAVGFDAAATVSKDRERFGLDEFTVTLDAVDELGEFVEVETAVESEAAVADRREAAFDVLRDLELDPAAQIRTSYLGLVLEDAPE